MQELVDSYFDEWAEAINNPAMQERFKQFANTDEGQPPMEVEIDRGQERPVMWPREDEGGSAKADFKGLRDKCASIKRGDTQLAVWRIKGKKYYAFQQMCPYSRTFALSDGLVGPSPYISCPFHKQNFSLTSGFCKNNSELSIATFDVEEREDGMVYIKLPPVEELDRELGTKKWMVEKGEAGDGQFGDLDDLNKRKGMEGKKGRRGGEARHQRGGKGGWEEIG
ncbi:Rieske [2Fe-2S] iron-sulfur domain-containing protein [Copromyces sp. CBS 386.78]|nr:Rieske [2Fe-2S] iron-sulfur domain-containing protein [Copromyces sp. CBS 386.78]